MGVDFDEAGDISGRIRLAMAFRGIDSEAELARRINESRQNVHRWLHGHANSMRVQQFMRIALALNVNGVWLALGESNMTRPVSLSADESILIELFRAATSSQQHAILSLIQTFGSTAQPPADIG